MYRIFGGIKMNMDIIFFESPAAFRKWLHKNHKEKTELWVGFYKRHSGKPTLTWPESVDEALCFGWIDGLRKGIDAESYKIRFSPRKPRSIWSAVNVRRAQKLIQSGCMQPSGLKAFQARMENRTAIYSYEKRPSEFDEISQKKFQTNKKAWEYFHSRAPWYRRAAIWWVISAKREETRWKRLQILIDESADNRLIAPLNRPAKTSK